ncbi:transposase IS4-like protein [Streptomyces brevispora]|uniref:Transposase IS4-like protein n=2 Tax=Streptomyces brevispora TaxID=887462 RepID=A0A561V6Q0_9ACTN|nr:transposase IS4-like protein [Streptomyces brevispora]
MPVHCVSPSALAAITRTVTVAAGRFAPGHLGELTPVMPFELVDAVLSETGTVQRRLRDLPSRVGVYFLVAMCLFPEVGYRLVWDKLTAGLSGMPVVCPSTKALRDLRRRVGSAPVRALFEVLAGPLAQPTTPGYGSARTGRCRSTVAARSKCPTVSATAAGWGGARTAAIPRSS